MNIGVFDSGVGGLTVLRELARTLPDARFLYFGDTARLPYGSKSAATVTRYAIEAARFLQAHGAEMLVVACNTATALALPALRSAINIPVEGVIEPGVAAAVAATKRKRVVVIATEATVGSHAYKLALEQHQISVCERACPLFVPLIEENWLEHSVTQRVAHEYLDSYFTDYETVPDVLVLGCTHYPIHKDLISWIMGPQVAVIDSASKCAEDVRGRLQAAQLQRTDRAGAGRLRCFVTDNSPRFAALASRFLGLVVDSPQWVSLEELHAAVAASGAELELRPAV